jgi:hypothetical protein
MRRWVPYALCAVLAVVSLGAAAASAASTSRPSGALASKLVTAGDLPPGWQVSLPPSLSDTSALLTGYCVPESESILGTSYAFVGLIPKNIDGDVSESVSWSGLHSTAAAKAALDAFIRCLDRTPPSLGRSPLDPILAGKEHAPSLGVRGQYASLELAEAGGFVVKSNHDLSYFVLRDGVSAWFTATVPPGGSMPYFLALLKAAALRL